jgi:DUF2911 family protein
MSLELRLRTGIFLDRMKSLRGVPLECSHGGSFDRRASPHEALSFTVGDRPALLCYGRPLAHGRTIFGDLVPWGELWRTGADEATTLHLPFKARIAGVCVPRGRYSIYTVPAESGWTLIVNRSVRQSGRTREEVGKQGNRFPSAYTPAVSQAEVGRAEVDVERCAHVEQLTISASPVSPTTTDLHLEWGTVRVTVPIRVRR